MDKVKKLEIQLLAKIGVAIVVARIFWSVLLPEGLLKTIICGICSAGLWILLLVILTIVSQPSEKDNG